MPRPVVSTIEGPNSTTVRVTVGSAEVWLRATPAGRRLSVLVDEGAGEVEVEWSIRQRAPREPRRSGRWVQS